MRRIAIVNLKGGTAKTTTATTLAVGLARRGRRVLAIDSDPSGNASWTLGGGQGAAPPTLASVLTRESSAAEAIRPTAIKGLDLLPADPSLGGVNVRLAQELGRDTRLRSALAPLDGTYDYVVVDTGPQFTSLLANVLVAVTEVVVPIDPGVYALLGLVALQDTLAEVREAYGNDQLRLSGLLVTRAARSNVTRDVEAELRSRFGSAVFKAVVPLSAKVEEACSRGVTVLDHAPTSPAALAYLQLVEEVDSHGRETNRRGGKAGRRPGAVDAA